MSQRWSVTHEASLAGTMSGGAESDHPAQPLQKWLPARPPCPAPVEASCCCLRLRRNTQSLPLRVAAPRVLTGGAERDSLANCTYRCHPTSCI